MHTSLSDCAIAVVANISELSSRCLFAHWVGLRAPDINEVVISTIEFNWHLYHFAIGHAGSLKWISCFHYLNIWQYLSTYFPLFADVRMIWEPETIDISSSTCLRCNSANTHNSSYHILYVLQHQSFSPGIYPVLHWSLSTDRPKTCWTWKVSGSVVGLLQKAAGAPALVLEMRLWICLSSSQSNL